MPELSPAAFSYRRDSSVPSFDDGKTLFVFDGVCVLCSGGASWLMRFDRKRKVAFTSMQGSLGQALYRHYDINPDESYLLLSGGRAYTASSGYLQLCRILGGPWHLLRIAIIIPERLSDAVYALVARNRYRWFGRVEFCKLLTAEQQARML